MAGKQLFQSLSGFLVRCNYLQGIRCFYKGDVSIPVGFSSSLQLSAVERLL